MIHPFPLAFSFKESHFITHCLPTLINLYLFPRELLSCHKIFRSVCSVFKRARAPSHFLLGIRAPCEAIVNFYWGISRAPMQWPGGTCLHEVSGLDLHPFPYLDQSHFLQACFPLVPGMVHLCLGHRCEQTACQVWVKYTIKLKPFQQIIAL